jgi:hypothetical protein
MSASADARRTLSCARVLFLMHEGIPATIFQSQIAVHAVEMKELGFDVEIWTYETTLKSAADSRRNLAQLASIGTLQVRLLRGMYVFLPCSDLVNAMILRWHLWLSRARFDLVHARSDYSAAVYSWIARGVGLPMLWDCRGDAYPETEQALEVHGRLPMVLQRSILRSVEHQEQRAGRACTAANFVSRLLKERKSRSLRGQPASIIPCAVSSRLFFFDRLLRAARRAELGYAADDIVLVYSGAMSTYQRFETYVDLVATMVEKGDTHVRLLVVTPDQEKARALIGSRLSPHVTQLHTAPYTAMNGFLNAADCGMLLRERSPINDVASPTKFGEYCLTGLPVILDGNVQQTIELSDALGNAVWYDAVRAGDALPLPDDDVRARIAAAAPEYLSRERVNSDYARLYQQTCGASSARAQIARTTQS